MQTTFLTIYHAFDDDEYSLREAQDSLLYMWQRSLQLNYVKFISSAKVEFKSYSLQEYPDQVKAKKEISNAYGHKRKKRDGGGVDYWWCGTKYPDLDTLYDALAKEKRLMELTITTED